MSSAEAAVVPSDLAARVKTLLSVHTTHLESMEQCKNNLGSDMLADASSQAEWDAMQRGLDEKLLADTLAAMGIPSVTSSMTQDDYKHARVVMNGGDVSRSFPAPVLAAVSGAMSSAVFRSLRATVQLPEAVPLAALCEQVKQPHPQSCTSATLVGGPLQQDDVSMCSSAGQPPANRQPVPHSPSSLVAAPAQRGLQPQFAAVGGAAPTGSVAPQEGCMLKCSAARPPVPPSPLLHTPSHPQQAALPLPTPSASLPPPSYPHHAPLLAPSQAEKTAAEVAAQAAKTAAEKAAQVAAAAAAEQAAQVVEEDLRVEVLGCTACPSATPWPLLPCPPLSVPTPPTTRLWQRGRPSPSPCLPL